MRGTRLARPVVGLAVLSGVLVAANCRRVPPPERPPAAEVLYVNGTVVTMDDAGTTATCVATKGPTILCVGSGDACCSQVRDKDTLVVDLQGSTVLPGFIDSHSHMSDWGLLNDPEHWTDISSVNVLLKPPPGDPRCKTPDDPQRCFIPVRTQDDVVDRLKAAAASSDAGPILGFNYDPSRLGHAKGCKDGGVAFQCTNFEDGTARAQLDRISKGRPILIGSESGHINYANGKELEALNICPPSGKRPPPSADGGACHLPIVNPPQEMKLAQLGQLDEDLALYATAAAIGETLGKDPVKGLVSAIRTSAEVYARNGFTSIQEGAASPGQGAAYLLAIAEPDFPVTARLLLYDNTSTDLQKLIPAATELKKLETANFQIAGLKQFADGSTQGYTGFLRAPYKRLFAPFTSTAIFPKQPYTGLPDVTRDALSVDFEAAHGAGFPLMVHQNGDAAIANVVAALASPQATAGPRDLMVHFALATPGDVQAAKNAGVGVTFLTPDLYYYGQPMCRQILGRERTARLYPAGDAVKAGLRFGLHADTPVTPPVPLFMVWTAKTRKTQQMPWYERDPECPEVMGADQAISILQGIKAFTIDAAYLYGLEGTLGSIEVGKTADLVQLSANPLSMEADPDQLKTIRVLATVHRGRRLPNPDAALPPIWPD